MRRSSLLAAVLIGLGCASSPPPAPAAVTPSAVTPDAPAAPRVETVDIPAEGERTIGATLVRPEGPGPHPTVVFIAGSGPTDRDWGGPLLPGPSRSGSMLADALAEHGIASLRYDKIGTGTTTVPTTITFDAFRDDARTALRFVAAQPEIDAGKLYLAGHSEGGLHAIRAARTGDPAVAGLLLLSVPGQSMQTTIARQLRNNLTGAGVPAETAEAEVAQWNGALDRFIAGEAVEITEVSERPGLRKLWFAFAAPAAAEVSRGMLGFDPAAALGEVSVPILVLGGGKDIQVEPSIDAAALHAAATEAGADVTLVVAEQADHTLKLEPRAVEDVRANLITLASHYNADGRTLDPVVVEAIVAFVGR
ncbi:MAG: alpha/beta hydrolase [Myxococcota bacterium]